MAVITKVAIRNGKSNGPHHADPKSMNGTVEFDVEASCTIRFDSSGVFAKDTYHLHKGTNTLPIDTQAGQTTFTVEYDDKSHKRTTMVAPAGPNDIIVP